MTETLLNSINSLYKKYKDINPLNVINNFQCVRDAKVFYIENGQEHLIEPSLSYINILQENSARSNNTFKVEGFEYWDNVIRKKCKGDKNHYIDCHFYWGKIGKSSFLPHYDDYDVVILMLKGKKTICFDDQDIKIVEGEYIHIPARKLHHAINDTENISLSFGIRKYYKDCEV